MSVRAAAPASLGRNVAWAVVGNAGYAACQWALLVVIARLGTAADLGRFALGLALAAPFVAFANMGLRALQATDARDQSPFGAYLGLRLLSAGGALLAIAVTAAALGYRGVTLGLVLAIGLAKAVESVNDVFFGFFQKSENLRRVAVSMLVKGVVSVVLVAGVLRATESIVTATLAMAGGWALLLVVQDVRAAARVGSVRPMVARDRLAPLARLALSAGIVSSLGSLTVTVPRLFVEREIGPVGLGHFAAMAYTLVAATQPMLALGAAVAPRLAAHFHADRRRYRALLGATLLAALALGLVTVVAAAVGGPAFLRVAYGADFAQDARPLVWLAAAAAANFVATGLGYAATAARRIAEQSVVAVVSFGVCVVASVMLVPAYGLVGAAWAVGATEATRAVCLGLVCARVLASGAGRRMSAAVMPRRRVADVTG